MQDKFNKFFNLYNGKGVEYSDPSNPYQCMDAAGKWCEFLGIPYEAIRHLYAYQVWTQPTDLTRKYFDLIPNSATNVAQVGDLVIFGQKVGTAGHISIGTNKSNSMDYVGFEQNWAGKKYLTTVVHQKYNGVLGFLRPKNITNSDDQKEQKIKDILNSPGTSTEHLSKIRQVL